MRKPFILLYTFIACLINGCNTEKGDSENKLHEIASSLILDANLIQYNELNDNTKSKISSFNAKYPHNWNDPVPFDAKTAFYIKAVINNRSLATLSASEAFSEEEILSDDVYNLYGKYLNKWELLGIDSAQVVNTSKFGGFDIISIERSGIHDTVYIGPIPQKPTILGIKILGTRFEGKKIYKSLN